MSNIKKHKSVLEKKVQSVELKQESLLLAQHTIHHNFPLDFSVNSRRHVCQSVS